MRVFVAACAMLIAPLLLGAGGAPAPVIADLQPTSATLASVLASYDAAAKTTRAFPRPAQPTGKRHSASR